MYGTVEKTRTSKCNSPQLTREVHSKKVVKNQNQGGVAIYRNAADAL